MQGAKCSPDILDRPVSRSVYLTGTGRLQSFKTLDLERKTRVKRLILVTSRPEKGETQITKNGCVQK